MDKRFEMRAEGINVSALVVLTENEKAKLECKDLEKAITNIAKELRCDWAIEVSDNVAIATISRQFGPSLGSIQEHEVELLATNFMTAVSKLELPVDKKVKEPEPSQLEDELNFCKEVLNGFDETEEEWGVLGARLFVGPEDGCVQLPCGRIGRSLLRKMFESFIKVHSNDE